MFRGFVRSAKIQIATKQKKEKKKELCKTRQREGFPSLQKIA